MTYADVLTVIHDDDTHTTYAKVAYQLHRDGIRIFTPAGEQTHTDVLMTQAYRATTTQCPEQRQRSDDRGPR